MESFSSIVHEYFDEIAAFHSMHCIEESEFHVRYGNDKVTFGIGWDCIRSYELGLAVQLRSSADDDRFTYELENILRFQNVTAAAKEIEGLRIEPSQDLRMPIGKLAQLTKTHAQKFLDGDVDSFLFLAAFMERRNEEYNAQLANVSERVRALYQQADLAWFAHDYRKVVEAYQSIAFPLSPVARERLAIAKGKVVQGPGAEA